jgi:mRNA-degrading endonuclease RelE of RelBE toxin-antitoxin system
MKTVAENLRDMADDIESQLKELLETHTKITRWNFPDRNSDFVFIGFGDYKFHPLPDAGRQIQSKVLEDFRHFADIVRTLLRRQPQSVIDEVKENESTILALIVQDNYTSLAHGAEAFEWARQQLSQMTDALKHLYDGSSGTPIFVPDANALLYNTDLEHWEFTGVPRFILAFTPTVLEELDKLKLSHRDSVQAKAKTLVNKLKEYRRRGKLTDGVSIVTGKIDGLAFAIEPNVSESLSWLKQENNDDKILASVIEIMRQHPRSPVALVTGDINMLNKAGFAGIEYAEPPEPA